MNKKFDVGIDLFKEFLLEMGFRYVEENAMYSDEFGDTWIYFSSIDSRRVNIFGSYTVLDYSRKEKINIVEFVKFIYERQSQIDAYNHAIEQAGIDW